MAGLTEHYQKRDVEVNESSDEKPHESQVEKARALADLPDPDDGKTPEERAAIVRRLPTPGRMKLSPAPDDKRIIA